MSGYPRALWTGLTYRLPGRLSDVAADLGISATPAREAILRLVGEGALELVNGASSPFRSSPWYR